MHAKFNELFYSTICFLNSLRTFTQTLLGRPVVAEPLMPDADKYVNCRKMYTMAQAYNQMIWNRWSKEYLPKWNVRSNWATDDERVLKVGDLVWLIDESVRRHENRMARVPEVFPGADPIRINEDCRWSPSKTCSKVGTCVLWVFSRWKQGRRWSRQRLENWQNLNTSQILKFIWII